MGLLQRQTEHQGTKTKHLRINCSKKKPQCLSIMCSIFSLSSTWKGYFLALSLNAVKSGGWSDLVFSVVDYSRRFHYKLNPRGMLISNSTKKKHICLENKHHLDNCVVDILASLDLIGLHVSKERDCLHYSPEGNYLTTTSNSPHKSKKHLELHLSTKSKVGEGFQYFDSELRCRIFPQNWKR